MAVTINQAALQALLTDPSGPVMLNMQERGRRVQQAARNLAPEYLGDLKVSIRLALTRLGDRLAVDVGSDLRYAGFVEFGTHGDYRGNPYFAGGHINQEFANWAISHGFDPELLGIHIMLHGTKPHPYLLPALAEAVL